jgi:CubicO group peptidase (beta-lactamase class C family)
MTKFNHIRSTPARFTRRGTVASGIALATSGAIGGELTAASRQPVSTPVASPAATNQADAISTIVEESMRELGLRAVIYRVTIGGDEIVTGAFGESMTGVPATADMRFRNGAVAISYMSTLLLILVDQGVVGLDDSIDAWLPDLPDSDTVTLRQLANMNSGYPDYVQNADFVTAFYDDPFRQWAPQELIDYGLSTPRMFESGTNWDYSHTGYVILGMALEEITGEPLDVLLARHALDPLGLTDTVGSSTASVPEPALHAFSSERRGHLQIPEDTRFYEESTYWNPSWTLPPGAVQTSTIHDLANTAEAIGSGTLLSAQSYEEQTSPKLIGFGSVLDGCPSCHTLDERFSYGLGTVIVGSWLLQNPLFAGISAIEAYLPSKQIAIAAAMTYDEAAIDSQGEFVHGQESIQIFNRIASYLAPDDLPPS